MNYKTNIKSTLEHVVQDSLRVVLLYTNLRIFHFFLKHQPEIYFHIEDLANEIKSFYYPVYLKVAGLNLQAVFQSCK